MSDAKPPVALGEVDPIQHQVQQGARCDNGGEHADQHADGQRYREALDDTSPEGPSEPYEDGAGNEGGDVRISDRGPGARPAGLDRTLQRSAGAQLFLQALRTQPV